MHIPPYPVIDLFAGCGGLGEGFSAVTCGRNDNTPPPFCVGLSIDKDRWACRTLRLRHFFREFPAGQAPEAYYEYLRGRIDEVQLYGGFPDEAERSQRTVQCITLSPEHHGTVRRLIADQLGTARKWVLIGGPPCQAYSVAGRARMKNMPGFASDVRHLLYREYLQILADHRPPVFVMENVKGLTSATLEGQSMIARIMSDLMDPQAALKRQAARSAPGYRLHALASGESQLFNEIPEAHDFVVRAEQHGVPQTRHRVFILGIRRDLQVRPGTLARRNPPTVGDVIGDLPRIRSGLTGSSDTPTSWRTAIGALADQDLSDAAGSREIMQQLEAGAAGRRSLSERNADAYEHREVSHDALRFIMSDSRLKHIDGHESRAHMASDLRRYAYVAGFAKVHGKSPKLRDLPKALLPAHGNIPKDGIPSQFEDRFKVQIADRPASTVTAHIAKDGHYYIHYDPVQCRSLTVREAARLQTFPDNFKFEGPRTEQYRQIGNAVPPYLASQIGEIVGEVLDAIGRKG